MSRPASTSKLSAALFEISALRDEVRALACELTLASESRYRSRLELLEAAAVRLMDECEQRGHTRSH
jgi:hypothetical protein